MVDSDALRIGDEAEFVHDAIDDDDEVSPGSKPSSTATAPGSASTSTARKASRAIE